MVDRRSPARCRSATLERPRVTYIVRPHRRLLESRTSMHTASTRLIVSLSLVSGLALAPVGAHAQEGPHQHNVAAVRVTDRPEIDGDLSDAVWQDAALIDAFIQQEPNEGAP